MKSDCGEWLVVLQVYNYRCSGPIPGMWSRVSAGLGPQRTESDGIRNGGADSKRAIHTLEVLQIVILNMTKPFFCSTQLTPKYLQVVGRRMQLDRKHGNNLTDGKIRFSPSANVRAINQMPSDAYGDHLLHLTITGNVGCKSSEA